MCRSGWKSRALRAASSAKACHEDRESTVWIACAAAARRRARPRYRRSRPTRGCRRRRRRRSRPASACASRPSKPNGSAQSDGTATAQDASMAARIASGSRRPSGSRATPRSVASVRARSYSADASPAIARIGRSTRSMRASARISEQSLLRDDPSGEQQAAGARARSRIVDERVARERRRCDHDAFGGDAVGAANRAMNSDETTTASACRHHIADLGALADAAQRLGTPRPMPGRGSPH